MKIEILVNLGSQEFPDHPFREGEVHEVEDKIAARLIARNLAIAVAIPEEKQSDKFTELRKSKARSESKEEK
jgi:hypothetical protein